LSNLDKIKIQRQSIHNLYFVWAAGVYLIFINIVGWFSDEYQDILLYTTLGIFTVLLIKRSRELERLQENQKQMLLDISHALQTPLAIFQAKLESVKDTVLGAATVLSLESSLSELSVFVSDLLRLSRLENSAECIHTPFNLSSTMEALLEEIRIIGTGDAIHVDSVITPSVTISGDPTKIREVVRGLTSNSIKHMRPEGEKRITFSLTKDGSWALLTIEDNGVGIGESDLPHIFERFWRAKGAEHRPGSGLGLALAKHIVERHGGTLTAKSRLGVGTTLTVRVPCIS